MEAPKLTANIPLISINQLAEFWGLDRNWIVCNWLNSDDPPPHFRDGDSVFFELESLQEWGRRRAINHSSRPQVAEPQPSGPVSLQKQAACEYLDIGQTSFQKLINDGEIPAGYMMAGRLHWDREDLDEFRAACSAKGERSVKRVQPRRRAMETVAG